MLRRPGGKGAAAEEGALFAGVCLDGSENIGSAVTGLIPVMRYRYLSPASFAGTLFRIRPVFPTGFLLQQIRVK